MDNLLVSAFYDSIVGTADPDSGLGFIERYGGLVRPLRYNERDADGNVYPLAYPVSCLIDDSCTEPSVYKALTPDSAYKSVAYFERRGSGSLTFGTPTQHDVTFRLPLRFVAWLNFKKLGVEGCPSTLAYMMAFIKALRSQNLSASDDTLTNPARVLVKIFEIPEQRADIIFAPYSYAVKEASFMPPYGFFAVDLVAELVTNLNCFTEPSIPAEIDCITTW
jgi:hypothetical protein